MTNYDFQTYGRKGTGKYVVAGVRLLVNGTTVAEAESTIYYDTPNSDVMRPIDTIDNSCVVNAGTYVLQDGDTINIPTPINYLGLNSDGTIAYQTLNTGIVCGMSNGFPPTLYRVSAGGSPPAVIPNTPDFMLSGGWKPAIDESSKRDVDMKGVRTQGTATITVGDLTENVCYYPCWGAGSTTSASYRYSELNKMLKVTFKTDSGAKVRVKVNGEWKEAKPKVKVSGEWKDVNKAYVNVGGTWKETK